MMITRERSTELSTKVPLERGYVVDPADALEWIVRPLMLNVDLRTGSEKVSNKRSVFMSKENCSSSGLVPSAV